MKKTMLLGVLLWTVGVSAQSNYETAMDKAFGDWRQGRAKEAIAGFERIAFVEKDNWIPIYYKVLVSIIEGYKLREPDQIATVVEGNKKVIDQWLDSGEGEWYVLRAMNTTLDLLTDPVNKGLLLSDSINEDYAKALERNSSNPRALYLMAGFNLRAAQFTKVDTSYYCEMLKRAVVLFDKEQTEIPFYPSWGKEQAEKELGHCQ